MIVSVVLFPDFILAGKGERGFRDLIRLIGASKDTARAKACPTQALPLTACVNGYPGLCRDG